MEIVQERLEREYSIELITTAPTVIYKVIDVNGKEIKIDNPSDMPDHGRISEIRTHRKFKHFGSAGLPRCRNNIMHLKKRHTKKLNLFG